MAEETSSQNGLPNLKDDRQTHTKPTTDVASTPSSKNVTGIVVNPQSKNYTTLTTVNTTAANSPGYILLINPSFSTNSSTTAASTTSTYSNAMFVPQPISLNLLNQVQGVMSNSKSSATNTDDVVEKAMDLSNLSSIEDSSQHPMTNAALTLVSLGSTVTQPVQEIVIDESGQSSFATNSNLPGVSVTVESEGSFQAVTSKSQTEPTSSGVNQQAGKSSISAQPRNMVLIREVVTQTGAGQGEVVIMKSRKKDNTRSLSSFLTEQSLERKRRAEMKLDEAEKLGKGLLFTLLFHALAPF